MKYYHGTNKKHDQEIIGPPPQIDVSKGRGELGQGFYVTSEPWIAKSWAVGKHGISDASVIEISFEGKEIEVMQMNSHILATQNDVIGNWIGLERTKRTKTFKFGKDIIDAPFATLDSARQYKFESKNAERILNNAIIKKIY